MGHSRIHAATRSHSWGRNLQFDSTVVALQLSCMHLHNENDLLQHDAETYTTTGTIQLQEDDTMPDDVHLIKEVQGLRARRLLRTLAVVQDLSDALMALNDVTGSLVYVSTAGFVHTHNTAWLQLLYDVRAFGIALSPTSMH